MAGVVHIPWYATTFRAERLLAALQDVAPIALRYGAREVQIHQSRDDQYRITQMCWFDSRLAWETFWEGPEMQRFRARYSGWYQVPLLYVWHEETTRLTADREGGEAVAAKQPAGAAA